MRNRVLFLFIAMTGLAIASAAQEDVAAPIHQTQEGFITLTTSGGSNVFRGTADIFWSPEALQSTSPNAVQRTYDDEQIVFHHNQSRKQEAFEANISLAAPVLKDRLFAFAFANYDKSDNLEVGANTAEQQTTRQPLWGVHLDWTPSKQHRLRGNFVSDRVDAKLITREFDPEALAFGQANDQGTQTFVTQASSLRYSGVLSDTVQISARLGSRSVDLHNQSERGEECPYAFDNRSGRPQRLGCWLDANIGTESDRRTNFRFDLDWYVGRHALRFGATVESIRYSRSEDYSGGVAYEYHLNGERFDSLSPESDLVRVRTRFENGAYKARSRAAYFQDRWLLSSTLTLDLGVRWEGYQQQNSLGETFIDVSRQLAPRVGIVWDIRGDGRSKLYGNAGIYHMPIRTESSLHVGSGAFSQDAWYTLEGDINPDGSPSLFGMQLSHHLYKDGSVPHPDETSSSDLEPMSTREIVVGYEQTVGANWSFGVRGTASRYNQVIEDILIDKALWDVYRIPCFDPAIIDSNMSCTQQHRLTNPGSDFKGWYDVDGDGELDSIFLPADVIGVPQANQTNYAVDLTFQRRFADRWMLQGVYTWSRSYGNYEDMATPGFLRKDTSTNHGFDVAALLEHSHGKLPADRRHTFKVFAMYAFDSGFQVGANYWFRSGRPINGFGMHPTDPWAQLHDNTAFYNDSEPCPRGCGGRTETTSSLDLNFRYNLSRWNAEWSVQLDVYNVINSGTATEVDDSAENISFLPNPSYLMATEFQAPRAVRLGFGVRF